jgi:hypothetical protein
MDFGKNVTEDELCEKSQPCFTNAEPRKIDPKQRQCRPGIFVRKCGGIKKSLAQRTDLTAMYSIEDELVYPTPRSKRIQGR